jgi:hypothetical protein
VHQHDRLALPFIEIGDINRAVAKGRHGGISNRVLGYCPSELGQAQREIRTPAHVLLGHAAADTAPTLVFQAQDRM